MPMSFLNVDMRSRDSQSMDGLLEIRKVQLKERPSDLQLEELVCFGHVLPWILDKKAAVLEI